MWFWLSDAAKRAMRVAIGLGSRNFGRCLRAEWTIFKIFRSTCVFMTCDALLLVQGGEHPSAADGM